MMKQRTFKPPKNELQFRTIDGETPLDLDEIAALKVKHVTTKGELDHLEQANIQNGLQWLRRNRNKDILNQTYICKLHQHLFGEVWKWAGAFRRTEKNIGVDPLQIAVQLQLLLEDQQFWIANSTYKPQEAAMRFHHRMVFIHPFANGNGRHARIMADAILTKLYHTNPIDWAGGHDLHKMGERKTQYIQALRAADRGDYALILSFAGL